MTDKYKLTNGPHSRVESGSRVTYNEGDIVEGLTEAELKNFPARFELIEEGKEDIQELLDEFHVGGGWYDIPEIEQKLRKEDAIEALEEGD